jgi:hypothetical protein
MRYGDNMGIFDRFKKVEALDEATAAFATKGENDTVKLKSKGEGVEDVLLADAFGATGLSSFNMFYDNYINRQFVDEIDKMKKYRQMANMPEIMDVIEDAANESTLQDDEGHLLWLDIRDEELAKNENIVKELNREFNELFYRRLKADTNLFRLMMHYYIDGRVYVERIINPNRHKDGIIAMKVLPAESMDFDYDPKTGEILQYYQILKGAKRPVNRQEAEKDKNVIVFNPSQISFINTGIYGKNRKDIIGYLDKARVPFNQLKLLETSVVIYRIIRAPERFVFKIDTGNMPKDKALKFVEKIKQKFVKKQTYNPETGKLSQDPEVLSILENFFLPQSADGRGSDIETVGGNAAGFAELDDIYYFARKLYRALKYPQSRVTAQQEKRESDVLFGGTSVGEIQRDEIKWSKYLERQQQRFCDDFRDLFLLHLEFKGIKRQYELNSHKIGCIMTPPNRYDEQMAQNFLETQFNNYSSLANNEEFSKAYLMQKYLGWDEDEIMANSKGLQKDVELGFKEEGGGF